ncbi:MAG TPA: ABC transporter substrate-binding protein [Jatrophihabitans sp.]|nr:ABC transporter substrate-binding protein [Jatrophihabitans sp.]
MLSACTGGGGTSSTPSDAANTLPGVQGGEVITDRSKFPTTLKESPVFAAQTKAGKLPAVADRIGQDPLVIKPVDGIGKYGGVLRRAFAGVEDYQNGNLFCAGPDSLLYWDYELKNVVPNIARDYQLSADATELTIYLRRGMKWSDGHPFTADDILFWRNDITLNTTIAHPNASLQIAGKPVSVERVDDYTVRYKSAVPYPALPLFFASANDLGGVSYGGATGGGGYAPKHYLSQFHPAYTSEAEATKLAKDAGLDSWPLYLLNRNTWYLNPDLPTLTPWTVSRPINNPPWEFTANPYSVWVDTEGNQLPYIPKISMSEVKTLEAETVQAAAGAYDFQDRGLQVKDLTVLIKNQERSDYTIHKNPSVSLDCAVRFNLAYDKDKEIGDLIRTVEFRRALSLAIDRHQVNETFFLGTATPTASRPAETSVYYLGKEWDNRWATHDVAQANKLLDQIGLDKRDSSGFRLTPSGKRVRLDIENVESIVDYTSIGDMIKQQWQKIGVDCTNGPIEGLLIVEKVAANEIMVHINALQGVEDPFVAEYGLIPSLTIGVSGLIGYPYVQWFLSNGTQGVEPPASVGDLKTAMDYYYKGLQSDEAERIRLGKKIFQLHADQVWSAGVCGFGLAFYGLYYAKNNLGNVPGRVLNSLQLKTPSNTMPMTFYYE